MKTSKKEAFGRKDDDVEAKKIVGRDGRIGKSQRDLTLDRQRREEQQKQRNKSNLEKKWGVAAQNNSNHHQYYKEKKGQGWNQGASQGTPFGPSLRRQGDFTKRENDRTYY